MIESYLLLYQTMNSLGKKWVVPLLIFLMIYDKKSFSSIKKSLRMTSRALSKKAEASRNYMGLLKK